LSALRGAGANLAGSQLGSIGGVADQLSGQLGGIGGELLGGLQQFAGQGAPGATTAISSLLGMLPGQQQLAGIAQGAGQAQPNVGDVSTPGLDFQPLLEAGGQLGGQLGALDQAIQRNLQSTLGTLSGQATLAGGQAGGGRQAFLSSEAGQEAQRSFATGASNILGADIAARRGLAGTAAGLALGQRQSDQQFALARGQLGLDASLGQTAQRLAASQALQGGALAQFGQAGQLGVQQAGAQLGAAQAGIGALNPLLGLGLAPFSAQFSPLMALGQLIGAPTVLSQASGFERSTSRSRARGGSEGFSLV
jgi:hypothetical protein